MATQKFCPRCGKLGTAVPNAEREIVKCDTHGVIYSAALLIKEAPPAAPAPTGKPVRSPKALNFSAETQGTAAARQPKALN